LFVETKSSVEAAKLIIGIDKLSVGAQKSYEGIRRSNVPFCTQYRNTGVLIDDSSRIADFSTIRSSLLEAAVKNSSLIFTEITGAIVTRQHQAEAIAPHLASCLDSNIRINNRSGMNCGNLCLENV